MKYSMLVLLILNSTYGYAENAADLGRLFFNEGERREISRLFKLPEQEPEFIEEPVIPTNITLNGLIIRSKGENSVWIDEKINPHKDGLHGLHIDIESLSLTQIDVPILIHTGEIQTYVKPGQKMDTSNGVVIETYADAVAPANDS